MASIDRDKLGEYLSAYLDDELNERERAAVERLVARDPRARAQLEELRRTVDLVRGLPHRAAPPSLIQDLTAAAEQAMQFVTAWAHEHPNSEGKPSAIATRVAKRLRAAITKLKEQ